MGVDFWKCEELDFGVDANIRKGTEINWSIAYANDLEIPHQVHNGNNTSIRTRCSPRLQFQDGPLWWGGAPSMAIYFPEIQKIWGNSSTSPPMLAYPAFLGGSTVTGLSSKPMHRFMPRIWDEFTYLWFFQICRPISWKSCALFPCFLTSQLCLYTPKKASKPRSRRNQQGPCWL